MVEKLSVQIALEGGKEIERELASVSKAGQKCFAEIQQAAEKAGGFANLDPAVVEQAFRKFGVTATTEIEKVKAAVKSAGKLEATVTGVAELEKHFRRAGGAASAASGSFGLLGLTLGRLDNAVAKVGAGFTRALGPIGTFARGLGPIGIAAGTVGAGSVALIRFAVAAEDTAKALTELQAVSRQSFSNLSALSNVFAQGGTPIQKFASEFGNLSEKIAAAGLDAKIRRADEASVKWANDIGMVRQKFDQLDVGTFSSLTSLDTKVKALLESLAKVPAADQWFRLADIFKNLGSDLERAQIGKALGLSPETIATLTLGGEKLRAMAEETRRLGLALDDVDKKNLSGLIASQTQAGALFEALKTKMGALVAPALTSFWQGFTNQIQNLIPTFTQLAQQFGQIDFSALGAAAANLIAILGEAAIEAGRLFAALAKGDTAGVEQALNNLGALIKQKVFGIGEEAGRGFGEGFKAKAAELGTAAGEAFAAGVLNSIKASLTPTTSLWDAILNDFIQFGASIVANAGILGEKIKRALGIGGAGGGVEALPMARGGFVGGRGTGTSDSNLAWLSRGEYVTPARAVRQPGVLAFLEALRRSGGNLSRVLDGMGRFALGGMVAPRLATIPAFAKGGLNGGGSSRVLNLTIDGRSFTGMSVPESTAQSLERFAVHSQIASTGRKPSWKR